jgi:hypothetical protein
MDQSGALIPSERIERAILFMRGQKVMLDVDLARLYEVPTKALNQAVRRNLPRFPDDFMFQLSNDETGAWRSQSATSNPERGMRSQTVTASKRNIRYRPYAFTEQGVAMLSSVLKSERAVLVNVEIMRTFVRLRQMLASHADLARKLEALENKYDAQFKVVFDAIRQLMEPPPAKPKRGRIGFGRENET